ncbi:MAG: hypothetical protein COA66_14165 [Arcobacter sp.]|nr:MAG: hypothetical protein COA66_14165 [Arcobacter sp.]
MIFSNIKDIDLNDKSSWIDNIFLTFDIDWASDDVLEYTLNILEEYNIKATFFVTHETSILERMRKNPNIELGIHPNFNPLLKGDFKYGKNIDEVMQYYKSIVPESVSVRSHALTQNSTYLSLLKKYNITYECNSYIPKNSNIELKPYLHWDKILIRVSHFWEDDLHCIYKDSWNVKKYLNYKGLKVFDFHPIHIYLNTEDLNRYESARNCFQNTDILNKKMNKDFFGTRNFLERILQG